MRNKPGETLGTCRLGCHHQVYAGQPQLALGFGIAAPGGDKDVGPPGPSRENDREVAGICANACHDALSAIYSAASRNSSRPASPCLTGTPRSRASSTRSSAMSSTTASYPSAVTRSYTRRPTLP